MNKTALVCGMTLALGAGVVGAATTDVFAILDAEGGTDVAQTAAAYSAGPSRPWSGWRVLDAESHGGADDAVPDTARIMASLPFPGIAGSNEE